VSRCPSLSTEAKRFESEQREILAQINALTEQARSSLPIPQKRIAIQTAFDQLHNQLQQHEAAENRLLAQGFGLQVNGDDTEYSALVYDR